MIKKNVTSIILKMRGKNIKNEYSKIKKIKNKDDLSEFKKLQLTKLIIHSYKNVPYYHQLIKNANIIHGETINISNFEKIPILTKEIIRNKEIISKDHKKRNWYYNYSGGSTGEPTGFIQDTNYSKWADATNMYYYKEMLDIDEINVKKISLWGSTRDLFKGNMGIKAKIGSWLTNTVWLNSFRMTEAEMGKYVKTINLYKPDLIRGYAGSLFELCRFVEVKNLKIFTPKIVVSAAETLNNEMREKIESVFGTKLYDFYGAREVGAIAGECRYGLMHIFEFNNHIEILDDKNQPVKEGQEGKIIVSNLHNFSMPFIRYKIGDMGILYMKKCKCGNPLPTLRKITGRIMQHFIKEDGTFIPSEFFIHLIGVICNKGSIKQFQVIQEEYDKIRILVIPNKMLSDVEKRDIENGIKLQMGQNCKIIWDYVEDIPKTRSGKYIYTKSLLLK